MCDINDLDISDAYNLIIESETIDWLLLGYKNTRDVISLYSSGVGGLSEFRKHLRMDKIFYGFVKLNNQCVLITWLPEQFTGIRRARALVHSRSIALYLNLHYAQLTASDMSDLSEDNIRALLKLDRQTCQRSSSTSYLEERAQRFDTSPIQRRSISQDRRKKAKEFPVKSRHSSISGLAKLEMDKKAPAEKQKEEKEEEEKRQRLEEEEKQRMEEERQRMEEEERQRLEEEERQRIEEEERQRIEEENQRIEEEENQRMEEEERQRIEEEERQRMEEEERQRMEEEERQRMEEEERQRMEEERQRMEQEERRKIVDREKEERAREVEQEMLQREQEIEKVRGLEEKEVLRQQELFEAKKMAEMTISGFISVQPNGTILWKRRFFTMKQKTLSFYKDELSATPLEVLDLDGVTLSNNMDLDFETSVPNSFILETKLNGSYQFAADDKQGLNAILSALQTVVSYQ
ncbi:hypothetical protein G6F46_002271 [Rhizopus delemar]|uniref:ADF-H domain-containing protein n=1 Tax=Rhizopus oryzae TaxID=64495 RepID=A0A9P6XVJ7_RHIOR|nr:hypothetical protein G6F54_009795 [Rhizopus delemar]KAG1506053.1 hypothetical protein G6F53_009968 [Rhizopus delemar]KAG1533080.1 hypothetical protein G6F51_012794 [Rhizopus arrhizus]KAG1620604.1 hypothetical protein G6F46_002271 [Rhizopus delemar]KAG1626415.1 hypothetical protein G6F45_008420 [Rhizopus arrhizus]